MGAYSGVASGAVAPDLPSARCPQRLEHQILDIVSLFERLWAQSEGQIVDWIQVAPRLQEHLRRLVQVFSTPVNVVRSIYLLECSLIPRPIFLTPPSDVLSPRALFFTPLRDLLYSPERSSICSLIGLFCGRNLSSRIERHNGRQDLC